MADKLLQIADDFWNIRGSFKIMGIDLGTQASLVRRSTGGFVLLDAYTPEGEVKDEVFDLTDGGRAIEAIVLLHPFHTVHVKRVAKMFEGAKLYGTARHVERAPDLPWQPERTESDAIRPLFEDDFDLLVPPGVHFVPDDPKLHFASVLAHHRASETLHVDDTLFYTDLPFVGGLGFHPSLKKVLVEAPGAAAAFRGWAEELAGRCSTVEQVCTAHGPKLPPSRSDGYELGARVAEALDKVGKMLGRHASKHG